MSTRDSGQNPIWDPVSTPPPGGWDLPSNPTSPAELPEHMPWYVLTRFAQSCHRAVADAHSRGAQAPQETHLLLIVNLAGLADRSRHALWPAAVDAYGAGAVRDRIVRAMGLEPDEFDAGLQAWIRRERERGTDPERLDTARDLLGLPGRSGVPR